MHKFLSFVKEFHIPKIQELATALQSFSKKEYYFIVAITVIALISVVIILNQLNNKLTKKISIFFMLQNSTIV